jgi:PPOX class probable F420-dependent enzyme
MKTTLQTLAEAQYAAVTTYRRNGDPVATAVWIAPDGGTLLVVTGRGTAKVKRLRNDPRVSMVPCSLSGKVRDGATTATGTAQVIDDPVEVQRLRGVIGRKYRFSYFFTRLWEWISRRVNDNVILRITPDQPD